MANINNLQNTTQNAAFMSLGTILQRQEIMGVAPTRYMTEGLFDFCKFTDRAEVSKQTTYNWMEEDALGQIVIVESVAGTAAAGAVATITLEEASHANSGALSPIIEGQEIVIYTATGVIYTRVRTVVKTTADAHTFTCQKDGVDIVSAVAINDVVAILSSSYADGTGQPGQKASLPLEFFNYTQIIKSSTGGDGSERANIQEIGVVDGQKRYVIKQEEKLRTSHGLDEDFAMLLGQRGTEPDKDGKTVFKTGGLDWFSSTLGNSDTYTTLAKADIVGWERTLTNEHVKGEVFLLAGAELDYVVSDVIRDLQVNTGISYAAFGEGDASTRSIDSGFDSFKLNHITFHKKVVGALNMKGRTQFTGSPFPFKGYIVPADKYVGKGGESKFKFMARYKESDQENRMRKVWERNQTITNVDSWELNYQSEIGFQAFCANQFIAVTK
jgi:hypothetical protein